MILKKQNKKKILIVTIIAFIAFSLCQEYVLTAPPHQCTVGVADICCNTGSLSYYDDCEGCGLISPSCTLCRAYSGYACSGGNCPGVVCYRTEAISHAACTDVPLFPCNLAGSSLYQDFCDGAGGIEDSNVCRTSAWHSSCTAPDADCNGIRVGNECDGKGHRCDSGCYCVCMPPSSGDWVINSVCTVTNKVYDVDGNLIIQGSGQLELKGTTNIRFLGSNREIHIYSSGEIHIYDTAGFNK